MGVRETCSRFIGDFLQAFRSSKPHLDPNESDPSCKPQQNEVKLDDKMVSALIAVFGIESNGRINKENVKQVVEKLGLLYDWEEDEKPSSFEGDDVPVQELLDGLEDMSKRSELLREAFKIFDKDGDGYIDAMELK